MHKETTIVELAARSNWHILCPLGPKDGGLSREAALAHDIVLSETLFPEVSSRE